MAKTFILGIGAQRTGSTWLHSQIKQNETINMGFCKEYHVFDALFAPHYANPEGSLLKQIRDLNFSAVKREMKRRSFIRNPENYFKYFDNLYQQNRVIEAVGDITPAYSMLNAEAFQFIRKGLERRGFHVKIIFIMRDPIERIWSMLHQAAKVRKVMQYNETIAAGMSIIMDPQSSMRTRYDRTITELETVFPKQDIFYGFYETFFNSASYTKLGHFLGLNLRIPNFDLIVNSSLMKTPMPLALAEGAAKHYAATYQFVLGRFGEPVRDLWGGFQYLDLPQSNDIKPHVE